MRKSNLAHRAFTLVEVLVVIAILLILAAILFPVFSRSRQNSRRAQCASNLKQLGLAWQMYADDCDGQAMPASNTVGTNDQRWVGTLGSSGFQSGTGLLHPWLKTTSVLSCPSWQRPKYATPSFADVQGYGYNSSVFLGQTDQYPTRTTALASIRKPAEMVLFADSAAFSPPDTDYIGFNHILSPTSKSPTFHGRHFGAGNIVWADGHVSANRLAYLDTGNKRTAALQREMEIGFIDRDNNYLTGEFFEADKSD